MNRSLLQLRIPAHIARFSHLVAPSLTTFRLAKLYPMACHANCDGSDLLAVRYCLRYLSVLDMASVLLD